MCRLAVFKPRRHSDLGPRRWPPSGMSLRNSKNNDAMSCCSSESDGIVWAFTVHDVWSNESEPSFLSMCDLIFRKQSKIWCNSIEVKPPFNASQHFGQPDQCRNHNMLQPHVCCVVNLSILGITCPVPLSRLFSYFPSLFRYIHKLKRFGAYKVAFSIFL